MYHERNLDDLYFGPSLMACVIFSFAKRYFSMGWVQKNKAEKRREDEKKKNTPFIHVLGRARGARRNMSFTSFIIFTSGIMTRSNFYFGNLYALQPLMWAHCEHTASLWKRKQETTQIKTDCEKVKVCIHCVCGAVKCEKKSEWAKEKERAKAKKLYIWANNE